MKINQREIKIEKILTGANYIGCGASKEAYSKDEIVYKVPRGRYLIQQGDFGAKLSYPDTMEKVDSFLEEVANYEEALVWPLGQFAIELIVWEAIKQLREEGLEINCFAEIKDYYLDENGVIVIEQEKTKEYEYECCSSEDEDERLWNELTKEIRALQPILEERFNIKLRDIRDGNCGIGKDGKLKLFDFGISTTTSLDSYGSYSDYCEDYDEYDYNSYEG